MRRVHNFFILVLLLSGSTIFSQDYSKISSIIANVSADSLIGNLNLLTGVNPVVLNGNSITISSRYRGTVGNANAALYLKNRLSNYKNLNVSFQPLPDSGKNVIAVQTGIVNPKRKIVICGHFDSMPSGPISTGADDDGSGTIAVLEAARVLSKYSSTNTIVYAMLDQEEDNLNGSEYFASQAFKNKDTIIAVINLDMLGWDMKNQFDIEVDTRTINTSDQIAKTVKDINDKCSIGLYVTVVNPGCLNADQASFWKYNFPAVLLTELYGNYNKFMHTTADNMQIINKPYYEKCTRLGIATAASYTDLTSIPGSGLIVAKNYSSLVSLDQNYPNPFNPSTIINYSIPFDGHVSLKIFDMLGREVATLIDGLNTKGSHQVVWNGINEASGIYFCKIRFGEQSLTKKLLLIK